MAQEITTKRIFVWYNGRFIVDIDQIAGMEILEYPPETFHVILLSGELMDIDKEGYDKLARVLMDRSIVIEIPW